jgi:hypothetical protein
LVHEAAQVPLWVVKEEASSLSVVHEAAKPH